MTLAATAHSPRANPIVRVVSRCRGGPNCNIWQKSVAKIGWVSKKSGHRRVVAIAIEGFQCQRQRGPRQGLPPTVAAENSKLHRHLAKKSSFGSAALKPIVTVASIRGIVIRASVSRARLQGD
jgi:hypothetical protein